MRNRVLLLRAARLLGVAFAAAAAAAILLSGAVLAASFREAVPEALIRSPEVSLEVRDRDGVLLREVRTRRGALASSVSLSRVSKSVVPALLAAEDARFFRHPGVDALAILRATAQLVTLRRVVSGASTLTQQLARAVVPRPRTFAGKFHEMALALAIERRLDKTRILEEYLSRVEFGPNLVGIDAASRWYFDKPASELDLAEAAALVAVVRGPSVYDPSRFPARLLARRNRILGRAQGRELADARAVAAAIAEPLHLQRRRALGGADHFVQALTSGALPERLPGGARARRIETTLDAELQREVETLVRRASPELGERGGSALSVLVVENATSEVLAYVGSPDYRDADALGANDGVLALRQPGSALKPFLYAAAMSELGMTAATLLPDVPVTFPGAAEPYSPRNYDGRFHGPVRLRVALGSSLNVPAVVVAEQLGPARVLETLHGVGFSSLTAAATHYGAALALGDGEVRLSELALAYSTLARGGVRVPLSFVRVARGADGEPVPIDRAPAVRVMDPAVATLVTHVLSDPDARAPSFERGGVLELPFPAAVKTGTSRGFRDNWAIGYTREVTVAVWAGNFDGTPMAGSTGVTGAGPLFHDALVAAMRGRTPAPLSDTQGLADVEVCALSGERASLACPHRRHELFRPGTEPDRECAMHERVSIDPSNGLLAGPGCPGAEERTFERYPARFAAWAKAARRPLTPERASPRCPRVTRPGVLAASSPRVRFPADGARFVVDGSGGAEIVLAARPAEGGDQVRFALDGRGLGAFRAPFEVPWRLAPGRHTLSVESLGSEDSVTFDVTRDD